jgi:membrane protease YdiL (CAAX protease family)
VTGLAVFNIAFISSNGWARLVWNFSGYASLFLAYRFAALSLGSIGLSKSSIRSGLKYASYVIAVILLAMLLVFIFDKTVFNDPRYHHRLSTALYSVLILLPLKTVLFEELAFRGILPAILLKVKNQRRYATIVSSLVFGFWHIYSATKIGNYHLAGNLTIPNVLVVAGVFVATSIAGYLFCELRWRSGSLIAPAAVHWFLNGFGIILASLSWS